MSAHNGSFPCGLAVNNPPAIQEPQEMQVWFLNWEEDSLEEGMAIHPSSLSWRLPWTEEPGGLRSRRLLRVKHNWSDLAHRHAARNELNICCCYCHHPHHDHYLCPILVLIWLNQMILPLTSRRKLRMSGMKFLDFYHQQGGWISSLLLSPFTVDKDDPLSTAYPPPPSCVFFPTLLSPSEQPFLGMEGSVRVNDWAWNWTRLTSVSDLPLPGFLTSLFIWKNGDNGLNDSRS